jgi:hypothetical protein
VTRSTAVNGQCRRPVTLAEDPCRALDQRLGEIMTWLAGSGRLRTGQEGIVQVAGAISFDADRRRRPAGPDRSDVIPGAALSPVQPNLA